jgi:DNA-binding transcriptional MerR regulator
MKPELSNQADGFTVYDPECETVYSLEVIAELAGVSTQTVLHYHAMGVIAPVTQAPAFDAECLRHLRRIEHLRHAYELNDNSLLFISNLLQEVEHLRQELRHIMHER